MKPAHPTDAEKRGILLHFFGCVSKEITRYRDYEAKTVGWTLVLNTGTASIARTLKLDGSVAVVTNTLISVFIVVALFYSFWHIHYLHTQLTFNRQLRHRLNRLLHLCEPNVFDKEPLVSYELSERTSKYTNGIEHLVAWWLLLFVSAVVALLAVWRK